MTQVSPNIYEPFEGGKAANAASRIVFGHYSQLDPKWGFEIGTERMMCGLISVKSVIDHYNEKSGLETPDIHSLLSAVAEADDKKPNGMSHAVEVDMLKAQGLVAWRRNWDAPSSNAQWFANNEGYTNEQVSAVNTQQASEFAYDTVAEKEIASIYESLEQQNPVIVSVKPGFGGNRADHQIVLVGTTQSEEGDSFVIMDPEHSPGSTLNSETVERFLHYFNNRAIFVRQ